MRAQILKSHHLEHLADLGYVNFPLRIRYEQTEYDAAVKDWKRSGVTDPKLLEAKALGHIYHRQQQQKDVSLTERAELHQHFRSLGRFVKAGLGATLLLLSLLVFFSVQAHCQFSHVNNVTVTDGTTSLFTAAPFKIMFSGCTVSGTGSAMVVTCAGSAANPGGTAHQLQVNSAGTAFAGIANGTAGQVLCSNGTTLDPSMCDPIVSGPDAPGVAPTKNPVQIGLFDGTNVQRILGSAAGRLSIDVNSAPTTAVTGTFWQATQPVSIATMPSTPVTGTFWQATQPVSGTFFQATQPASLADGTDATLGAKADAKSTATDVTAVSIMQVMKEISAMEQAPASRAVTNAGTFATQATLSAETTKVIGTVNVAASQTIAVTNATAANLKVDLSGTSANATAIKVDGSAVTQPVSGTVTTSPPANASTNIAQVSGAVTSATNPLYTRETDGTNPVILDPCRTQANIFKPISQTASAQLVTGTSAKKIYICSINLVTAGANNVAVVEGTGTVCATGIAGMAGGTTAATGWNFAANGGLTQGNGMGSIMAEATNADNLCLLQSAAVQLSGSIGYVLQ